MQANRPIQLPVIDDVTDHLAYADEGDQPERTLPKSSVKSKPNVKERLLVAESDHYLSNFNQINSVTPHLLHQLLKLSLHFIESKNEEDKEHPETISRIRLARVRQYLFHILPRENEKTS
jgi:hypothetical protein